MRPTTHNLQQRVGRSMSSAMLRLDEWLVQRWVSRAH